MKKLILDYFEETVRRFPEKTAFADIDTELSFASLSAEARRAASAFIPYSTPEEIIPFYLDKGTPAIVGFLGAVYAGCAYSQINLRYPPARVQKILETLQAPFVVTDLVHKDALEQITDLRILVLEDILSTEENEVSLAERRGKLTSQAPLYVNFTSGSTGAPKGVVVNHTNVIQFISEFVQCFSITEKDVIANQAPFDFDVSVKDIYSGLFTGARVEIIPTAYFMNPVKLGDFLSERKVTLLIWAVSALCFLTSMGILDYRRPQAVRVVMFSGEVMPIKHLKKLRAALPEAQFVNLYGPTEITCNCTYYVVNREFSTEDSLPLGVPFGNCKVFLLDENDREVTEPMGVGELCVSGGSVAMGYLRNPEKTDECFCQNPLNTKWQERMYRTGDLVRLTEDGDMVYVSRKDFQIKHMGHRIELTGIDAALQAAPGVDRACCQYIDGKIVAFIRAQTDRQQIAGALAQTLPDYMLPNRYVFVDHMPLNKNGKIDRQALKDLLERT